MFLEILFKSFNNEYIVVLLPHPVSPTINTIPDLFDIISFMIFIASFENPISSFVLKKLSLFKILRTVFSP